jgi:hypothetical protein
MPTNKCELCGEPMPPGEEVFRYHGYSGPCPKPPAPKVSAMPERDPTFVSSHNGILRFFAFTHLPPHLQAVSKPFFDLADKVAHANDTSPETAVALRKLLEAKDAAVRAALPQ